MCWRQRSRVKMPLLAPDLWPSSLIHAKPQILVRGLPGSDSKRCCSFPSPSQPSVWPRCPFCPATAKPLCGFWQVGLDQQTVKLVCTNRRKQFLLDTADMALAE